MLDLASSINNNVLLSTTIHDTCHQHHPPPPCVTTIPNSHCHSLPPSTTYNHGTQPTMEQPTAMWQHHVMSHNNHQHPSEYPPPFIPTHLTHTQHNNAARTRTMMAEARKTQPGHARMTCEDDNDKAMITTMWR